MSAFLAHSMALVMMMDVITTVIGVYGLGNIEVNPLARIVPLPILLVASFLAAIVLARNYQILPKWFRFFFAPMLMIRMGFLALNISGILTAGAILLYF